jgi:hypothetical protein
MIEKKKHSWTSGVSVQHKLDNELKFKQLITLYTILIISKLAECNKYCILPDVQSLGPNNSRGPWRPPNVLHTTDGSV